MNANNMRKVDVVCLNCSIQWIAMIPFGVQVPQYECPNCGVQLGVPLIHPNDAQPQMVMALYPFGGVNQLQGSNQLM